MISMINILHMIIKILKYYRLNRAFLYLFSLIFIISCKDKGSNYIDILDSSIIDKSQNDAIVGIWGMTNYFDSITYNKSIASYRIQPLTWSSIILEIKNDSISQYGSIFRSEKEFELLSSNIIFKDSSNRVDCDYVFIYDEPYIIATFQDLCSDIDSIKYYFRRRPDLKRILIDKENYFEFEKCVASYFSEQILIGDYLGIDEEVVSFKKDGKVKGFKNFSSYSIGSYFGTLHPFKNLDYLVFRDSGNVETYYHWEISNDMLVLKPFVLDSSDRFRLGGVEYSFVIE